MLRGKHRRSILGQVDFGSKRIALPEDLTPQFAPSRVVHRENVDCRPAGRRRAGDPFAVELEMIRPVFSSRVEQGCDQARSRIDAAEIWPLVQVAPMTSKGEIVRIIGTTVLPGHDVFNVMSQLAVFLM